MKKLLIAGAAMAALAAAGSAHAVTYPGYGNDSNGPSLIISIDSAGVASIANGPGFSQGPYDGSEDTYIGVENNYGKSISSLHLSAPGVDIFGFDSDGIDTYGAVEVAGNPDGSTYGGPIGYFTNINGAGDAGDVNFFGGLASGASTYFSLEEPLSTATFGGSSSEK